MNDERAMPVIQPLRKNRHYLFLISAQAVSNLGDWIYILALIVLIGVHRHGSPAAIAIMMLCISAPMIVLGPFTGILADRMNRTVLMMISNLVMAALVAIIPLVQQLWVIYLLLIAIGCFESVFGPAEQGKLKEIVPDQHMHQATSTKTAINQSTKIIGPGISGFLVATLGAMSAFYLDAASFVISAVLLLFTGLGTTMTRTTDSMSTAEIKTANATSDSGNTVEQPLKENFRTNWRLGWIHIIGNRLLLVGLLLMVVIILIVQLVDSQFITLLRILPIFSPNLFGYLMAAAGAGTLTTSLVTGRFQWRSVVTVMALGTLGLGIGYSGIALIVKYNWPWWLIPALGFFAGCAAGFVFIPFQTAAQQETPVSLTGRVFGVIGSVTTGAGLLGPVVGGIIITLYGAIQGFIITGCILAVLGAAALLSKHWLEPRDDIDTQSDGGAQKTAAP